MAVELHGASAAFFLEHVQPRTAELRALPIAVWDLLVPLLVAIEAVTVEWPAPRALGVACLLDKNSNPDGGKANEKPTEKRPSRRRRRA